MGKGLIRISLIAIRDMLRLPEAYLFIEAAYNRQNDTLEILVEHPDIPAPGPETRHIEVRPIYQAEHERIVRLKEVQMIEHKIPTETPEETMKRLGIRRRRSDTDRP